MSQNCIKIKYFDKICNRELIELLSIFNNEPNVDSDTFLKIKDYIWEEGTCYPDFYIVVPQLIRIASCLNLFLSKDLWSYLGCWISNQEKYREDISEEILDDFDKSLLIAEKECITQICAYDRLNDLDAQYIYAAIFSFAKHRFGYMTLAGYKDDIEGVSVSSCPEGHINDYSIFNSCIVEYEGEEKACDIAIVDMDEDFPDRIGDNPWAMFLDSFLQKSVQEGISYDIQSHFKIASKIVSKGVTSSLKMKYAFTLYGCLLYCNGSYDASMRAFHGWDKVCCRECGKIFVFADGWCEDIW